MSWVICQLAERECTRAVNTDLVAHAEDRGAFTVLSFIDGTKFSIQGGLQQWLNNLTAGAEAELAWEKGR